MVGPCIVDLAFGILYPPFAEFLASVPIFFMFVVSRDLIRSKP